MGLPKDSVAHLCREVGTKKKKNQSCFTCSFGAQPAPVTECASCFPPVLRHSSTCGLRGSVRVGKKKMRKKGAQATNLDRIRSIVSSLSELNLESVDPALWNAFVAAGDAVVASCISSASNESKHPPSQLAKKMQTEKKKQRNKQGVF